jgi:putative transposase
LDVPRGCRSDLPDGVYHVTARGTGGVMVFVDDYDRAVFVRHLRKTARLFSLEMIAWCLMGTHFHLIVDSSREQLSYAMHRLAGLYAQGFNRRHGRRGHLFEERFSARVIVDEDHLWRAINYVLENPVSAGLCRDWRDWTWSWSVLDERSFLVETAVGGTVPRTRLEEAGDGTVGARTA